MNLFIAQLDYRYYYYFKTSAPVTSQQEQHQEPVSKVYRMTNTAYTELV